jgi:TolB protein
LVPSPNSKQIAFWGCPGSLSADCNSGENLNVWVIDWDGTNLHNLTKDSTQDGLHPDWSPDGRQVVFESWGTGSGEIYIMNADGSEVRRLTEGASNNREPKWSPDGKWIAYHCEQSTDIEATTRICVVSPDGESAGDAISGLDPTWSPLLAGGESRLAFRCKGQGGQDDICTARPDGSEWVNMTNNSGDDFNQAWSPDGKWIAYISNRNSKLDIYKICIDCAGEPTEIRLTNENGYVGWPSWSPDGRQMAYVMVMEKDILLMSANGSSDAALLASGSWSGVVWRGGTE